MTAFAAAAAGFPDPFRLLIRDSVESTNDEVRILGQAGAPEGLVLIAQNQSAGRGRRGAAWFASPGESLAFSILVRPTEAKALWPRLALAAGLAVAEAMDRFGLQAGIKWPNDVWLNGKKVAGILVEAGSDFAVVGIGINVNSTAFPAAISELATSMRIESGNAISLSEVLAAVVTRFSIRGRGLGQGFNDVLTAIRQRCVLTGHEVSLTAAHGMERGVVEGLGEGGELLLRTEAGMQRILQADEVRLVSR